MKKFLAYAFVGIVLFIILISAISAHAAITYPYQYNYVTSSITFDENGKAVLVATLNAETLSDQAVDEITLRIPYSDVSIWYVKEQVEKRDLIISLYKDCYYPLPYETTAGFPSTAQMYPIRCSGTIGSNVYYSPEYFDVNLDVAGDSGGIYTETRGGSTYVTIPLRGAFYSKEAKDKIESINKKDAERQLPNLTEKFNQSGKNSDEIKHSNYEVAGKITIKYSIPNAIKVAAKEGKLEFKTLTDVNAPIEILTVGVSAPYGYKFEGTPDFPIATQAEVQRSPFATPLASASAGGGSYAVSKDAIASPTVAQKTTTAINELTQIESDGAISTQPYPYPEPYPQPQIDYIEVRSNIDANEIITVEGKYKTTKETTTELPFDLEKYLPYILGIVIILAVAGVAQKYKLLWG